MPRLMSLTNVVKHMTISANHDHDDSAVSNGWVSSNGSVSSGDGSNDCERDDFIIADTSSYDSRKILLSRPMLVFPIRRNQSTEKPIFCAIEFAENRRKPRSNLGQKENRQTDKLGKRFHLSFFDRLCFHMST
jgi:hypothetical protein